MKVHGQGAGTTWGHVNHTRSFLGSSKDRQPGSREQRQCVYTRLCLYCTCVCTLTAPSSLASLRPLKHLPDVGMPAQEQAFSLRSWKLPVRAAGTELTRGPSHLFSHPPSSEKHPVSWPVCSWTADTKPAARSGRERRVHGQDGGAAGGERLLGQSRDSLRPAQ